MKNRIITALILAFILVPVALVPQLIYVFEILVICFAGIATFEILNMYDKQKKMPIYVKILCLFLTILLYSSIIYKFDICSETLIYKFIDWIDFQLEILICIAIITLCLLASLVFIPDFDASDVGKCLTQILYVGVCFGSFSVLRCYGVRFIVYVLMITVATDIFALVFGLNFGKHKMAPKISPKKSWEGAIGGTLVALVIGFCILYFYEYLSPFFHNGEKMSFFSGVFDIEIFSRVGTVFFMLILTLCMSICSQIGDLVASKLKRTYGIKDYSNIFPGHGGVLDRFDSALFASLIFLLFIHFESIIFPVISG